MKGKLTSWITLVLLVWLSLSEISLLIAQNSLSAVTETICTRSNLSSPEDKIDLGYHAAWIVQKERSLHDACQMANW